MAKLIYTPTKKSFWIAVTLTGIVFIGLLVASMSWLKIIPFPYNVIAIALFLCYFGYLFAKQFNKLAAVVSCPHCSAPLQPQVDAAKVSGIFVKFCPYCGGPVEA